MDRDQSRDAGGTAGDNREERREEKKNTSCPEGEEEGRTRAHLELIGLIATALCWKRRTGGSPGVLRLVSTAAAAAVAPLFEMHGRRPR